MLTFAHYNRVPCNRIHALRAFIHLQEGRPCLRGMALGLYRCVPSFISMFICVRLNTRNLTVQMLFHLWDGNIFKCAHNKHLCINNTPWLPEANWGAQTAISTCKLHTNQQGWITSYIFSSIEQAFGISHAPIHKVWPNFRVLCLMNATGSPSGAPFFWQGVKAVWSLTGVLT